MFNHLFFEMKMMTLFSMLFGAGLVLMGERADQRGASLRGVYYRRCLWLLVIGLIHSYLIWFGDILVMYAECGLIIYLFRRWRPQDADPRRRRLPLRACADRDGLRGRVRLPRKYGEEGGGRGKGRQAADAVPGVDLPRRVEAQDPPEIDPDAPKKKEDFEKAIKVHRGGYAGIVKERAKKLFFAQTLGFILGGFWLAGGRMLIGMGLMKLDVFSGRRSRRFYFWLVLLGYGIGLPLVAYDAYELIHTNFGFRFQLHGGIFLNFFGSVLVALGHVGALMLIYKAGVLTWLTSRLAAVGRMALTNYLTHSIVCTTSVLRLRLRRVRACQPHRAGGHRAGHLDRPAAGAARSGWSDSASGPPSGYGGR